MNYQEIYSKLYRSKVYMTTRRAIKHAHRRKKIYWSFIKRVLPAPATVLDIGCGKNFLLQRLHSKGYTVTGTEVVPALCQDTPFPILPISCEELGKLQNPYDLVVISDVLEHLGTEEEVLETIDHVFRLASKYVIIAVGLLKDCDYIENGELVNMHPFLRLPNWWYTLIEKHCIIINSFNLFSSFVIYGQSNI